MTVTQTTDAYGFPIIRFDSWATTSGLKYISVYVKGSKVKEVSFYGDQAAYIEVNIREKPDQMINVFPNSRTGYVSAVLMKADMYTVLDYYNDYSYQIPENEYTIPSFNWRIEPLDLVNNFYISNQSAVRVNISDASTKYGATGNLVVSIGGKTYNAPYQSDKLPAGNLPIVATLTDSRGFVAKKETSINVYDYLNPIITSAEGKTAIIVARCDSEGEITASGRFLYIAARKRYSPIDGSNKCTLTYKIKKGSLGSWSEGILLANDSASNEFDGIVSGVDLDTAKVYPIEIYAEDTMGNEDIFRITIPSEKVYMEKSGTRNSIAFGGHVSENNAFEVYQDAYFRGTLYIDDLTNEENGKRYKLVIGDDGVLRAEQVVTTFSLRRR